MLRDCLPLLGLGVLLFLPLAAGADEPQREPGDGALRVMSYNIRYDNPADGANAWPNRKALVVELLQRERPDLLGVQEALAAQARDLQAMLPDCDSYGVGRDDGKSAGEHMTIFYRRDRLEPLEKKTLWLSATPDEPSRGWDAACHRTATLMKFKDKAAGGEFWAINTHFDHMGINARRQSARLLTRVIAEHCGDLPTVVIGDFNTRPATPPYEILTGVKQKEAAAYLQDARTLAAEPQGPESTFNGFKETVPGAQIDFIFLRGPWKVESFATIIAEKEGRFASDHHPLRADLSLLEQDADAVPKAE